MAVLKSGANIGNTVAPHLPCCSRAALPKRKRIPVSYGFNGYTVFEQVQIAHEGSDALRLTQR